MDVQQKSRGRALSVTLAVIVAAALVAGACGGGGSDDAEADQPTVAATAEAVDDGGAESTPQGDAVIDTVELDKTIWHSGWKLRLGTAALTEKSFGPRTVEIDAVFENLGVEAATFNSVVAIVTDGGGFDAEGGTNDVPSNVGGGLKSNGVLAVQVDEDFEFDDATLVIGNSENNQAKVPLGPEGEALVTQEPVALDVTGQIVAGALTIDVEGVEVRADVPDTHDQIEEGYKLVIVRFRATPASGIQIGQGVLQSEAVALKLPDGTSVSVRQDGRSGVNELLQGREGTTIRDLSVRFEVPEPLAGAFAFHVQGAYGPGGARVEGELPFEIALAGASDDSTPAAGTTALAPVQP
jgi:hypothetical protein